MSSRSPKAAAALCGLALALAAMVMFAPSAEAQSLEQVPSTEPCVSFVTDCNASGVCTGPIPDGGSKAGIPANRLRAYYLRACPPRYQTITATGSIRNYHCWPDGKCPELKGNKQTITEATVNPWEDALFPDGGQDRRYGHQGCWESQPFEVPYAERAQGSSVFVPDGITLAVPDGGDLTLSVCPAR